MTNKNSWLITGVGSDKELFQIVLFPKKDSSICEWILLFGGKKWPVVKIDFEVCETGTITIFNPL